MYWFAGAALVLGSGLAVAQEAPRSILPPVFQQPAPTSTPPREAEPAPPPAGAASPAPTVRNPPREIVQPLPAEPVESSAPTSSAPPPVSVPAQALEGLPSLRQIESLSPSELDRLLGLRPRFDIPPGLQRSPERAGVLSLAESAVPSEALARQPASLVRAAIAGTEGPLVARWGQIMLRRVLMSRLAAPEGMAPAEFVALRTALLNRLGEHQAARALAQTVDVAQWDDALTAAAVEAYLGSGDVLGICPATIQRGSGGGNPQWQMLSAICSAFAGESTRAQTDLERMRRQGVQPRVDVLLAQRFAAAAGSRRGYTVEWAIDDALTPWRYALATSLSEPIPDRLTADLPFYYRRIAAVMPMLPAAARAEAAYTAAAAGVLSSAAMVDLFGQIYAGGEDRNAGAGRISALLRTAYVANDPAVRLQALEAIWTDSEGEDYGSRVLTAYAAARVPPEERFADEAGPLIASMLTAGLDRSAARWLDVVPEGSEGWALAALGAPGDLRVSSGAVSRFIDADASTGRRRSQFLVAGLAGLGRLHDGAAADLARDLGADLTPRTRWALTIERAAQADNRVLVALLAGLGMQGESWERMTARQLFQIVSTLRRVGMEAEARMIAAEAVARV
ncbi:hypothetical protein [Qipengyuania thermophila]|uniref:hypothetical protein n=1 Tax=Qipengyuania thermophila TaxID=2509361 RepID=UPI0013EDB629|nr:hypothetical protein [Qipengyuania thermophila]